MTQHQENTNQLLETACPSIRYRIRTEVLGESPFNQGMASLQSQILEDDLVKTVLGWRHTDGWLGRDFHGYNSMVWFHRMEMLARLGVIGSNPALQNQLSTLHEIMNEGGGTFRKHLSHSFFNKWGAYSGLMLERDWRSPTRRTCDLTFRSLLISHYAGL